MKLLARIAPAEMWAPERAQLNEDLALLAEMTEDLPAGELKTFLTALIEALSAGEEVTLISGGGDG